MASPAVANVLATPTSKAHTGKPVVRIVAYEAPVANLSIFDAHRGTLPKDFKLDRDELNQRR